MPRRTAAGRMAVTCSLGLNGASASAVNMLDGVDGGADQSVAVAAAVRRIGVNGHLRSFGAPARTRTCTQRR